AKEASDESAPKTSLNQGVQGDERKPKEKDAPKIGHQPFTVSGRAVDVAGQPVSGATIFLISGNMSPDRLLAKTTTDKDGRYEFRDAQLPYRTNQGDEEWAEEQGSFQILGESKSHAFTCCRLKTLLIVTRKAFQGFRRGALIATRWPDPWYYTDDRIN